MMPISIRFTEEERSMLQKFADFNGISLSTAVKNIVFERLEDEYDMHLVEKYLKKPNQKSYSMKDTAALLGIEDEI
jgi:predicted DNA-binding protein